MNHINKAGIVFFLTFTLAALTSPGAQEKKESTKTGAPAPIQGGAILTELEKLDNEYRNFLTTYDIENIMSFQREAMQPGAPPELVEKKEKVMKEYREMLKGLSAGVFENLFQQNSLYQVNTPCALVIIDAYYNEEMLHDNEQPELIEIMASLICGEKEQAGGTITFVLEIDSKVRPELEKLNFSITGALDIPVFPGQNQFTEYRATGILQETQMLLTGPAHWEPPMMDPTQKGILTVSGKLVSPGKLLR